MRKLSPEDRRLWDFVTRSVVPIKPRHAALDDGAPLPKPTQSRRNVTTAPAPPHRAVHQQPLHVGRLVDLDGATAKKFRKGRMPCDGRLDLHGLTLAQAHNALVHFIRSQAERGARCVLVITGKGSSAAHTEGALHSSRGRIKAELMHWLNAAPLRQVILAVTPANPKQPESGAVYVLLKRRQTIT
jgi:DNA-nicking Smr family endonuclease